jgi:hypothetical protein
VSTLPTAEWQNFRCRKHMQCDSKGVSLVPELFEASRLEVCVRAGRVQWWEGQERRTLLVKHYHLHVRQAPPTPARCWRRPNPMSRGCWRLKGPSGGQRLSRNQGRMKLREVGRNDGLSWGTKRAAAEANGSLPTSASDAPEPENDREIGGSSHVT